MNRLESSLVAILTLTEYEEKDLMKSFDSKVKKYIEVRPNTQIKRKSVFDYNDYVACLSDTFQQFSSNTSNEEVYSPKDLDNLDKLIHFYIFFGVYPHLDNNLYPFLIERCNSKLIPKRSSQDDSLLCETLNLLISVYFKFIEYRPRIFEKYSLDIITGLMHLTNNGRLTELKAFLNKIPRHVAFSDLLILQGTLKSSNVPAWIRKLSSRYLSLLLITPNDYSSVLSLVTSVCMLTCNREFVERPPADNSLQMDQNKFNRVSKVLADILLRHPVQINNSELFRREYLQFISKELIPFLKDPQRAKISLHHTAPVIDEFPRLLHQLALDVVHLSMRLPGRDSMDYFIKPSFNCLFSVVGSSHASSEKLIKLDTNLTKEIETFKDLMMKIDKNSEIEHFYDILSFLFILLVESTAAIVDRLPADVKKNLEALTYILSQIMVESVKTHQDVPHLIDYLFILFGSREMFKNLIFIPAWKIVTTESDGQNPQDSPFTISISPQEETANVDHDWVYQRAMPNIIDIFRTVDNIKSDTMKSDCLMNEKSQNEKDFTNLLLVDDKSSSEEPITGRVLFNLLESISSELITLQTRMRNEDIKLISKDSESDTIRLGNMSYFSAMIIETIDVQSIWLRDARTIIQFFENNLQRILSWFISSNNRASENSGIDSLFKKNLTLTLALILHFIHSVDQISDIKRSVEIKNRLESLLPVLDAILVNANHQYSGDEEEMYRSQCDVINHIRINITTRGALKIEKLEEIFEKTLNLQNEPEEISTHKLIQEMEEDDQYAEADASNLELDVKLKEAFEQLNDKFIPVQGHALIVLSRLVESNDPVVVGYENLIFRKCVEMLLKSEDSYIYLNAIRCLSSLGSRFVSRLLPLLCRLFVGSDTTKIANVNFRLTIGESIVRICKTLGPFSPKYRDLIVGTMTKVSNEQNELLRSAALSNLGELCPNLCHSFHAVATEIVLLIEFHLKSDISPMVRKAAGFLASRVLGIRDDSLDEEKLASWLPPTTLRDLNRILKNASDLERDESVKETLDQTLYQLSKKTKSSIFEQKVVLEKEISILKNFML